MDNLLSHRAETVANWEDFFYKYLTLCVNDPYDEKENPKGYVNLGTSINNLCTDITHPKLTSKDVWSCDTSLLQYREGYGIPSIREAFAKLMTEFLEAHEPVSPEDLYCLTGVTSCIDTIAHCLADPGDVFLVPSPLYGRICTNLKQRSLVDIWPIAIIDEKETEDFPILTLEKVVTAYENAIAAQRTVRGVLLLNPSNPLGDIYPPQLLMNIMAFCKEHSLHYIVDEVYALSVFSGKEEKFHSTLKFCSVPDPERTHVLYGISKDFGIAGLRVGVIHTKCEPLKKCLVQLSYFQNVPIPVMEITARFLDDLDWCRSYIKTNQQRLAEKFNFCANYLRNMGLKVREAAAGFFIWVDFRHLCGSSFEQENHFFNYIMEEARIYIGPGKEFFCAQPGWFRIVFTESPNHVEEGLRRLKEAMGKYKPVLPSEPSGAS